MDSSNAAIRRIFPLSGLPQIAEIIKDSHVFVTF